MNKQIISLSGIFTNINSIKVFANENNKAASFENLNSIDYKESILNGKKVITMKDGENEIKIEYKDTFGNEIDCIYENSKKMTKNEYLNKYVVLEKFIDINQKKVQENKSTWVYAYSTKTTFSKEVTSTLGIISILMISCNIVYSVALQIALGVLDMFCGIGSFIEFYMVNKIYQDRNDIHICKNITYFYKYSYTSGWFNQSIAYFSTRLPIGPQIS